MAFRTLEEQNNAIAAARVEQARKNCIASVYAAHQQFVRCEANDRMIISFIKDYVGPDVIPTASLFEDALALNPEDIKNFSRQPLAVALDQAVAEYITLLAAHSRQSEHTLKIERQKMLNMPLAEARAKLAALKLRQGMAAQPITELRKIVQDAAQPNYGYPQLPKEVWEGGKYVAIDQNYLKHCDRHTFARLCRVYGEKAVMARRVGQ